MIWNFFSVLVPFLFVLTVVVFIHELGHFLVARWNGVSIQAFSIGFGREIWGFNDRHGTRWRLAWIPLGGYVKFIDDENGASAPSREAFERLSAQDRAGAFQSKTLGQRAAVVAAGPIANFLLAITIFASIFYLVGVPVTEPRVDEVMPGGAAEAAGFKAGDLIVSIDGEPIESFNDMQRIVGANADTELTFVVERGGSRITLKATPGRRELTDRFGNKMRVGVIGIKRATKPQDWEYRHYGPLEAVWLGVKETHFIVAKTIGYVRDVALGREAADQLGGPIRIAEVSGQVASAGFVPLLNLTAVLSVSIGLINLFPIPLLDGGHLLFYALEAVRRRPLSERAQEIGFRIGLTLVLMLMIYATFNDLPIVRRWIGLG
ncbi:MAG TPA: RIP metalloprotease RseP [Hyphomicrobiaceae bacterium]|jgi:regulator of sigma E protease|nr:RIP metalloprotease RseP [Hyphomicrobiaceae bacterium]